MSTPPPPRYRPPGISSIYMGESSISQLECILIFLLVWGGLVVIGSLILRKRHTISYEPCIEVQSRLRVKCGMV